MERFERSRIDIPYEFIKNIFPSDPKIGESIFAICNPAKGISPLYSLEQIINHLLSDHRLVQSFRIFISSEEIGDDREAIERVSLEVAWSLVEKLLEE